MPQNKFGDNQVIGGCWGIGKTYELCDYFLNRLGGGQIPEPILMAEAT